MNHDRASVRGHRKGRSLAVLVAAKVVIVAVVLVVPAGFALSLGAAHGIALLLVAVAAVVLFIRGRGRRRPAAAAVIETANASRYLDQLCAHATKFGHRHTHAHVARVLDVDRSGTHATVNLGWGRCVLDAGPTALTVRIEAGNEEKLRRVHDIIAADLERFGRTEELAVTWQPVPAG